MIVVTPTFPLCTVTSSVKVKTQCYTNQSSDFSLSVLRQTWYFIHVHFLMAASLPGEVLHVQNKRHLLPLHKRFLNLAHFKHAHTDVILHSCKMCLNFIGKILPQRHASCFSTYPHNCLSDTREENQNCNVTKNYKKKFTDLKNIFYLPNQILSAWTVLITKSTYMFRICFILQKWNIHIFF